MHILYIHVDARRPYLFVTEQKQNFFKNISNQKTRDIFACNKINGLSFTAFKNFKLELMETFQFIQSRTFRNECKLYREKNSYTCSVNDSLWTKITKITIIIARFCINYKFGKPWEA